MYFFSRIALFLVACCGWAVLFFGGWIAVRGVFFYAADPVLMGTGGGLAVGGLLVVGLTIGAGAQVSTARDTRLMREMMQKRSIPANEPPAATPRANLATPSRGLRAEPKVSRPKAER